MAYLTATPPRDHRIPVAFWTAADILALRTAIASGVKRVLYDGPPKREVEYQSLGEMRDALAEMRADVEEAPTFRRAKWSKGFYS